MTNRKLNAIKLVLQEYWSGLSSNERREVLCNIVTHRQLPKKHPIFNTDDIPYSCIKAWMEEVIAKKDMGIEYVQEPCGC